MKKYIIITTFIAAIVGCKRKTADHAQKRDNDVSTYAISNLATDTVKQNGTILSIHLNGKIQAAEDKLVNIFPMISGITESIKIQQGDHVGKDQVLATLQSAEIAGFNKDAVISQANLNNTRREMEISEDLYKSGLSSLKEVEQLRGEYQKAMAENKQSLAVLKMNRSGQKQTYEIRTPLSGFVIGKNISTGTQVRSDNTQSLFTIADLSKVNVVFNIYESDISSVHQGDSVRITTLSYPDKIFEGKIEKIYNQIDQESTVIKAKAVINNPGFILKPGMFANVEVISHQSNILPYINANNIIFDKNHNYVLVKESSDKVRIQQVELGKRVEDRVYILSGLKAGERIIASRQVYLYQALKR
ncbi:efflux RND transporter periplasmic adaptor subunit [Chitinophaga sancti]|uniref:Efflux RND transporter periplasmic adaptor subunit n=1 Tax=Chitinophaga sancti TaxID=1004 RepID=A0A1K1T2X7_9BACT|nr:efflux RND transporter periplasmic adaptor subunit [Chitinophaga sancti]WQD63847.1 efflux RND transporter periplasmic adaptor subunit [Chitinophaga sancti]WQG90528.1 efflux RND transporter periplasmic adaptor subunit [Chitinophaga sancti]SFW90429.1 membrane fusion protein, cobalt-zinc-cadmium efflux system [Chitinophaga sancti]